MAKKRYKNKHKKKLGTLRITKNFFTLDRDPLLNKLAEITKRRTGGQISIQGFIFQYKYAAWRVLNYLYQNKEINSRYIHLEGVEDIDFIKISEIDTRIEFAQVKYSKNKMDAGKFWNLGILQNFVEVYLKYLDSIFRFVHNMDFSKGHLDYLATFSKKKDKMPTNTYRFWSEKFKELQNLQKAKIKEAKEKNRDYSYLDWDWSSFDLADFLSKLIFEKVTEDSLDLKITRLIIENYKISTGNEQQYVLALNIFILNKSRLRAKLTYQDLTKLIESVRIDIAKGPINPAVQSRWLEAVDFNIGENKDLKSYFEGKAARPFHIAAGLPVHRKDWKEKILKAFSDSDVTVIRASSGQGKSTLAWQVAYDLVKKCWRPYELLWCEDEKEIGNIVTLIESRIKIGERIAIIIDGLRKSVSAWGELASRMLRLPIKFIVTTREEDWYRYGADRSKLRLMPISIEMTANEAETIFYQFKKAKKLHPNIEHWQPAWERVADRRLLMEYVYLLTQGMMLEERLSSQISQLQNDLDSKAKIGILRLISVADLCSIRLPTSFLISKIENNIGFNGDPGECLKSLQKEYLIQFEDKYYVEGLHPIRSKHLVDILQSSLPIDDTLVNLLSLIDTDNIFQYCANAPLLVTGKQRISFFEKLASHFSKKSYLEMSIVVDGLFSTDAYQNWQDNKASYDDLYSTGAGIFAMDVFPWSKINILESLAKNVSNTDLSKGIKNLALILKQINPFNPEKSGTLVFIKKLYGLLRNTDINTDLNGIGRLVYWFNKFGQDFPPFLKMDKSDFLKVFFNLSTKEAGELFNALYLVVPDTYNEILCTHKSEIIGHIKHRTNTLLIEERDSDLYIEYFIDFEEVQESINDQSVKRITTIRSFLPQYKNYSIKGLRIPIPGLEEFQKYDESFKNMPVDNVPNYFEVNLNQIWMKRISIMYESQSVYEWQKQWYNIRIKSIELSKACIAFFENFLGSKGLKSKAKQVDNLRPQVIKLLVARKDFPSKFNKSDKTFNESEFKDDIRRINNWATSWLNFLQQLNTFFETGQKNPGYIANSNMQDAKRRLEEMQDAFDSISCKTFQYFDTKKLKEDELISYSRLAKTTSFLINNQDKIGKVVNPRITIAEWFKNLEINRLKSIKQAMSELEILTGWSIIIPSFTIEADNLRKAVIGIRGLKWEEFGDEGKFSNLLIGMCSLVNLDVDQYIVITIEGNHAEKPIGLSVYKDFLNRLKYSIDNNIELGEKEFGKPMPIYINEKILMPLAGISMPQIVENPITSTVSNIIYYLWRLTQVRQRLSKESPIELVWLKELEKNYNSKLSEFLEILRSKKSNDLAKKYQIIITKVADKDESFTTDFLQQLLLEDVYPS